MIRKIILISLFVLESNSFSEGLESFTTEIKNMQQHQNEIFKKTRGKIEWTIGKGVYVFSNGTYVKFDVDKDYVVDKKDKLIYDGWDTEFSYEKRFRYGRLIFARVEYDKYYDEIEDYNFHTGINWNLFGGNLTTLLTYDRTTGWYNDNKYKNTDQYGISIDFYKYYSLYIGKFGNTELEIGMYNDIKKANETKYEDHEKGWYVTSELEWTLTHTFPSIGPLKPYISVYDDVYKSFDIPNVYNNFEMTAGSKLDFKYKNMLLQFYISYQLIDRITYIEKNDNLSGYITKTKYGDRELATGIKFIWTK